MKETRNIPAAKGPKEDQGQTPSILGVCASILLRHKNVHMNALQRIISLVLHTGHSAKQVYAHAYVLLRCQCVHSIHTGICEASEALSRHRTLTYLDHIGEKHDAEVLRWRTNIEDTMTTSKVSAYTNLMYILVTVSHKLLNFSSVCVHYHSRG